MEQNLNNGKIISTSRLIEELCKISLVYYTPDVIDFSALEDEMNKIENG